MAVLVISHKLSVFNQLYLIPVSLVGSVNYLNIIPNKKGPLRGGLLGI